MHPLLVHPAFAELPFVLFVEPCGVIWTRANTWEQGEAWTIDSVWVPIRRVQVLMRVN